MASTDVLYHVIIAQGIEQYVACNGAWQQNVSCAWCINLAKKRGGTKSNQIEMTSYFVLRPHKHDGHECSGHLNL